MNTKLKAQLIALAAILGSAMGTAQATPYTWVDLHDANVLLNRNNPSYTFTHNIGTLGPTDTILDASLTVWLYDDAFYGDVPVLGDAQETATFQFGGQLSPAQSINSIFYIRDVFSFSSITNLLSDGTLTVIINRISGDFYFDKSLLLAYGDKGDVTGEVTAVPEPSSLMLLGIGLLGMGIAMRKKGIQRS
jgi:hypothetical protein